MLTPVTRLTTTERNIFNAIVTRNGHLRAADALLVTVLARQVGLVLREYREGDASSVEKATRTMLALARSLRLTPQALQDPRVAFRKRNAAAPSELELFLDEDDERDDDDGEDANP